jgi:DNA recombination protein RmuC
MKEGSQFRPDVVVFLPENRNIIIDAKVPMKDWYEFQNTNEESIREEAIKNFINSIKSHINSIHKKDYKNLLNINSPDYVFIFMPHEFAFVTAQKFDTTLANYAQQKQIVIVGPSTLIMCMKLIESIWKLEKQNKNSSEIANLAGQMYDQIIKSINLLEKTENSIQKSLENIVQSKNYIKDGRGSLFSRANKMKELRSKYKN